MARLQWDEILNNDLKNEWVDFTKNILELSNLKISRCLANKKVRNKVELHGYADASLKAYGCCLYLRIIYEDEIVSCKLICSKSRVSLLRTVSLPRLELCACVLLAYLSKRILDIFKNSFHISSVNLWTDSQICLTWMLSHPSKWNIFVSNRVAIIQEYTSEFHWRFVRSLDNPADYVSRGLSAKELI